MNIIIFLMNESKTNKKSFKTLMGNNKSFIDAINRIGRCYQVIWEAHQVSTKSENLNIKVN